MPVGVPVRPPGFQGGFAADSDVVRQTPTRQRSNRVISDPTFVKAPRLFDAGGDRITERRLRMLFLFGQSDVY